MTQLIGMCVLRTFLTPKFIFILFAINSVTAIIHISVRLSLQYNVLLLNKIKFLSLWTRTCLFLVAHIGN